MINAVIFSFLFSWLHIGNGSEHVNTHAHKRATEVLIVFMYIDQQCDLPPIVYEVQGEHREKIGTLLPYNGNYPDHFTSFYNRDVEVATLRSYLQDGFELGAFKNTEIDGGCGSKRQYILTRGRNAEVNQNLFE